MKALIRFEFQKILRRRSTLIVCAVSLLVTAFLFALPVMQYQVYDHGEPRKGLNGVAFQKAQFSGGDIWLTDESVAGQIDEVRQLFKNPENVGVDGGEEFLIGDAYWNSVAPREDLLNLIAGNYAPPGEFAGYSALAKLDLSAGPRFYETRAEKIRAIVGDPARRMSGQQTAFWEKRNSQVAQPLRYGYFEGWRVLFSSWELFLFAVLAVCIAVAPVFCGEYQAGTDAVILAGKYGKTRVAAAKIIASYLFGALAFLVHIGLACAIVFLTFGPEGWDLPLQINGLSVPYPWTFLQAALINFGVIFLVLFAMIALTLLLSAKMKSAYLVLAVLVPVLFLPMFLTPSGTTGLLSRIAFLLPYRSTMPELGHYISYQFGGLVLDVLSVRAIVYALFSLAVPPLAGRGFRRHQPGA